MYLLPLLSESIPPPPFLKLNPQIHFKAGGRVVHSTPTPTDFPQYQYQCYLVLLLEKRNFVAIKIKVIIYQGLFWKFRTYVRYNEKRARRKSSKMTQLGISTRSFPKFSPFGMLHPRPLPPKRYSVVEVLASYEKGVTCGERMQ